MHIYIGPLMVVVKLRQGELMYEEEEGGWGMEAGRITVNGIS